MTELIKLVSKSGAYMLMTCLAVAGCAENPPAADNSRQHRTGQLVDFFTRTVHAGQCALSMEAEVQSDPGLFDPDGLSVAGLKSLLALADSMAALGEERLAAWVQGEAPDADIERLLAASSAAPAPLAPGLPYNVLKTWLEQRFSGMDRNSILAMSNAFQLITEIERDGDLVQQLMALYGKLGLKQCLTPFGLDGGSLDTLLAVAEKLAPLTGKTPFELEIIDWQLLLHKMEMWDAKISGRRDRKVLATEMIAADPEVIAMLDKLRALPPKRVAFLGHSLTMSVHWSTYSSWCDLAAEIVVAVNPEFSYADINSGGLSPEKTLVRGHLDEILAYQPQETYILMSARDMMAQSAALDSIIGVIKSVGSRCWIVDGVRPWNFQQPGSLEEYHAWLRTYCADKDIQVLEFQQLWQTEQADTSGWRPLKQDIHMCTPGHVFYARKLLEFWIGQVGE